MRSCRFYIFLMAIACLALAAAKPSKIEGHAENAEVEAVQPASVPISIAWSEPATVVHPLVHVKSKADFFDYAEEQHAYNEPPTAVKPMRGLGKSLAATVVRLVTGHGKSLKPSAILPHKKYDGNVDVSNKSAYIKLKETLMNLQAIDPIPSLTNDLEN